MIFQRVTVSWSWGWEGNGSQLYYVFFYREERGRATSVLYVDSLWIFLFIPCEHCVSGNWRVVLEETGTVLSHGGGWGREAVTGDETATVQDTTRKTVTTTLNFKQMVNILNLNIKNNSLVGININILILSITYFLFFSHWNILLYVLKLYRISACHVNNTDVKTV